MELRFFNDPESGLPHIFEHGVNETEVRQALSNPAEDRAGDEGSRVAIGKTAAGRLLKVIYAKDEAGDGAFVITAYDLTGKPLKAFRRRHKKRRRK